MRCAMPLKKTGERRNHADDVRAAGYDIRCRRTVARPVSEYGRGEHDAREFTESAYGIVVPVYKAERF